MSKDPVTQEEINKWREHFGYTFKPENMKDVRHKYRVNSLMHEYQSQGAQGAIPLFTFKPDDWEGALSFHRVIVEIGDPTCYIPALVLFGSWLHWERFMNSQQFRNCVTTALDELEIKLRAKALQEMQTIASGSSGSALQAAKYLAEGKWKTTNRKKTYIGRPKKEDSKKEKDKEEKIVQLLDEETLDDYERLGLGQSGD